MNKLEMAHQWAMKCLESGLTAQISDLVAESWKYADLMQAEADKRLKQKAIDDAQSSKILFEKLTDNRSLTKDENGS